MRLEVIFWKDYFRGYRIEEMIVRDLNELVKLINFLNNNDYELINWNREGIIVKPIQLSANVPEYFTKEDKTTEVTGEFFLFYDHLPEHIKKEIKIYINKTEER